MNYRGNKVDRDLPMKNILVSIGGASGSIYGIRLLEFLQDRNIHTFLIVSEGAKKIIDHETSHSYSSLKKLVDTVYENDNLFAGPASGSFSLDAMVIVPCSMKTLSAVANGYSDTLTARAASCMLKEHKTLIIVPRETPMDLPSLQNMVKAYQAGAFILPAMPGFYYIPSSINDLVDFIVGKILDQLHIPHTLYQKWK